MPDDFIGEWEVEMRAALDLDPVIREALRPVYDRLKQETPHLAAAMALAMIARGMRMIESPTLTEAELAEARAAIVDLARRMVESGIWTN